MHAAIAAVERARARAMYAAAARRYARACGRVGADERVADRADGGVAFRGSCHQCGSPAPPDGDAVAEDDDGGLAAGRREHLRHPAVEAVAALEHDASRRAAASTSAGRGSYSCGSVFGWRIWWTSTRRRRRSRAQSPICVVVATTARRSAGAARSSRSRRGASSAAAAGAASAEGGHRARSGREREDAAGEHGDRGARRHVRLDREPEPGGSSTATSATEPTCHGASRRVSSRTVAAGTTKSAVASSAPIVESAATTPERDERRAAPRRAAASGARARARRPGRSRPRASGGRGARPRRAPPRATAAASASSRVPTSSRLPKSSVSTFAPEWKTSLARITPSASAPTSTSAVRLS